MGKIPTTRIQIKVSQEMNDRISDYASKMGLTKSSFCSFVVGQAVMNFDNVNGYLANMVSEVNRNNKLRGSNDEVND